MAAWDGGSSGKVKHLVIKKASKTVHNLGRDGGEITHFNTRGQPQYKSDDPKNKPKLSVSIGLPGSKKVTHRGREAKPAGAGLLSKAEGEQARPIPTDFLDVNRAAKEFKERDPKGYKAVTDYIDNYRADKGAVGVRNYLKNEHGRLNLSGAGRYTQHDVDRYAAVLSHYSEKWGKEKDPQKLHDKFNAGADRKYISDRMGTKGKQELGKLVEAGSGGYNDSSYFGKRQWDKPEEIKDKTGVKDPEQEKTPEVSPKEPEKSPESTEPESPKPETIPAPSEAAPEKKPATPEVKPEPVPQVTPEKTPEQKPAPGEPQPVAPPAGPEKTPEKAPAPAPEQQPGQAPPTEGAPAATGTQDKQPPAQPPATPPPGGGREKKPEETGGSGSKPINAAAWKKTKKGYSNVITGEWISDEEFMSRMRASYRGGKTIGESLATYGPGGGVVSGVAQAGETAIGTTRRFTEAGEEGKELPGKPEAEKPKAEEIKIEEGKGPDLRDNFYHESRPIKEDLDSVKDSKAFQDAVEKHYKLSQPELDKKIDDYYDKVIDKDTGPTSKAEYLDHLAAMQARYGGNARAADSRLQKEASGRYTQKIKDKNKAEAEASKEKEKAKTPTGEVPPAAAAGGEGTSTAGTSEEEAPIIQVAPAIPLSSVSKKEDWSKEYEAQITADSKKPLGEGSILRGKSQHWKIISQGNDADGNPFFHLRGENGDERLLSKHKAENWMVQEYQFGEEELSRKKTEKPPIEIKDRALFKDSDRKISDAVDTVSSSSTRTKYAELLSDLRDVPEWHYEGILRNSYEEYKKDPSKFSDKDLADIGAQLYLTYGDRAKEAHEAFMSNKMLPQANSRREEVFGGKAGIVEEGGEGEGGAGTSEFFGGDATVEKKPTVTQVGKSPIVQPDESTEKTKYEHRAKKEIPKGSSLKELGYEEPKTVIESGTAAEAPEGSEEVEVTRKEIPPAEKKTLEQDKEARDKLKEVEKQIPVKEEKTEVAEKPAEGFTYTGSSKKGKKVAGQPLSQSHQRKMDKLADAVKVIQDVDSGKLSPDVLQGDKEGALAISTIEKYAGLSPHEYLSSDHWNPFGHEEKRESQVGNLAQKIQDKTNFPMVEKITGKKSETVAEAPTEAVEKPKGKKGKGEKVPKAKPEKEAKSEKDSARKEAQSLRDQIDALREQIGLPKGKKPAEAKPVVEKTPAAKPEKVSKPKAEKVPKVKTTSEKSAKEKPKGKKPVVPLKESKPEVPAKEPKLVVPTKEPKTETSAEKKPETVSAKAEPKVEKPAEAKPVAEKPKAEKKERKTTSKKPRYIHPGPGEEETVGGRMKDKDVKTMDSLAEHLGHIHDALTGKTDINKLFGDKEEGSTGSVRALMYQGGHIDPKNYIPNDRKPVGKEKADQIVRDLAKKVQYSTRYPMMDKMGFSKEEKPAEAEEKPSSLFRPEKEKQEKPAMTSAEHEESAFRDIEKQIEEYKAKGDDKSVKELSAVLESWKKQSKKEKQPVKKGYMLPGYQDMQANNALQGDPGDRKPTQKPLGKRGIYGEPLPKEYKEKKLTVKKGIGGNKGKLAAGLVAGVIAPGATMSNAAAGAGSSAKLGGGTINAMKNFHNPSAVKSLVIKGGGAPPRIAATGKNRREEYKNSFDSGATGVSASNSNAEDDPDKDEKMKVIEYKKSLTVPKGETKKDFASERIAHHMKKKGKNPPENLRKQAVAIGLSEAGLSNKSLKVEEDPVEKSLRRMRFLANKI